MTKDETIDMIILDYKNGNQSAMSDLIDRQDAIDAIDKKFGRCLNIPICKEIRDVAKETIKALPSAQPERKKGKWILHENQRQEDIDNGNYLYVCSECGKSDIHAKTQEVPFCWWCGADMRGDSDDD